MSVLTARSASSAPNLSVEPADDIDAAVTAAAALPRWRAIPALQRGRLLTDLARAMRADQDHLAALERSETGKPQAVALLMSMPAGETLDVAPDPVHIPASQDVLG